MQASLGVALREGLGCKVVGLRQRRRAAQDDLPLPCCRAGASSGDRRCRFTVPVVEQVRRHSGGVQGHFAEGARFERKRRGVEFPRRQWLLAGRGLPERIEARPHCLRRGGTRGLRSSVVGHRWWLPRLGRAGQGNIHRPRHRYQCDVGGAFSLARHPHHRRTRAILRRRSAERACLSGLCGRHGQGAPVLHQRWPLRLLQLHPLRPRRGDRAVDSTWRPGARRRSGWAQVLVHRFRPHLRRL
mmetsp:Transcript_114228/g.322992  ORF Transcript_114228/g.322992 Transcript_114228/m.322992 type:complete len:243 (-) Transcript_114228:452-1180(-)